MTPPEPAAARLDVGDLDLDAAVALAHDRYRCARPNSAAAYDRARAVLPGGNTRSVLHFDPFPFRVAEGHGAELFDIDGHRYVDFCGNYSAALLGPGPTAVADAITDVLREGWAIGATHLREIELAELLCARFASIESVRFTNSGTEANLLAIATALHRAATREPGAPIRRGVGVFDHGYHGGVLSFGDLEGPHHPLNVPYDVHVATFNDIDGLDDLFRNDLACVIVEAVQGSGGCRPASPEFLQELRRRCSTSDVILILDEVMTSRLAPGGAQERYDIRPDLTTLGKYLAGGLSFGAFGGRSDLLQAFDPAAGGPLTQAGTFNNNRLSMAAAIAVLRHELTDDRVVAVNALGDHLRAGLNDTFASLGAPFRVTGLGSMSCVHTDDQRFLDLYFHAMLDRGHYLARRGFMALSFHIERHHAHQLLADTRTWWTELTRSRGSVPTTR